MLYKYGSTGHDVSLIREKLGLSKTELFDKETKEAVIKFQIENKLDADGVVGPKTFAKLGIEPAVVYLTTTPVITVNKESPVDAVTQKKQQMIDLFGDPMIAGWKGTYLVQIPVPPDLRHVRGWDKGYFWGNKLVAPRFSDVLNKIAQAGLSKELWTFGGCWNVRMKRGKEDELSVHSWAVAYDLNPDENPMGSIGTIHLDIVRIHKECGFVWGGDFHGTRDDQHFQYVKGY